MLGDKNLTHPGAMHMCGGDMVATFLIGTFSSAILVPWPYHEQNTALSVLRLGLAEICISTVQTFLFPCRIGFEDSNDDALQVRFLHYEYRSYILRGKRAVHLHL
jgi:hypothetical protein